MKKGKKVADDLKFKVEHEPLIDTIETEHVVNGPVVSVQITETHSKYCNCIPCCFGGRVYTKRA